VDNDHIFSWGDQYHQWLGMPLILAA